MKKQEYQMNYAIWCMMMLTICIAYSLLQYFFKLALRRFTRRGRAAAVENDDHSNIIEGKSLLKQCFSFLSMRGRKSKYLKESPGRFKYESPPNERVLYDCRNEFLSIEGV